MQNLDAAALRAGELANQLLQFARRKSAGIQIIKINAAVEETVRFLRRALGARVECTVQLDPCDPVIQADAGHLTQVLMNLCLNARDAMPKGGRLSISTVALAISAADLESHPSRRPGRFVRLRVSDTGTGITAEVQRHMFDLFSTTKSPEQGSGVGLATVLRIAQQCDGWIECSSEPGYGASFDVYLPQASA
jgi:hypothetical protein